MYTKTIHQNIITYFYWQLHSTGGTHLSLLCWIMVLTSNGEVCIYMQCQTDKMEDSQIPVYVMWNLEISFSTNTESYMVESLCNSEGILFSSLAGVSKCHMVIVSTPYDLPSYSYGMITKSTTKTTHQTKSHELANSLWHILVKLICMQLIYI